VEEEAGVVAQQQVLEGLAQMQKVAMARADGVELAPHLAPQRARHEVHLQKTGEETNKSGSTLAARQS
jgi:hypothetical protein